MSSSTPKQLKPETVCLEEEQLVSYLAKLIPQKGEQEIKRVLDDLCTTGRWIKKTTRVQDIKDAVDAQLPLTAYFNFDFVVKAGLQILKKMTEEFDDPCVVLWGHKNQGKSQTLHFLFVLLRDLNEYVVHLDQTAIPCEGKSKVDEPGLSCVHEWKHLFGKNQDCKDRLDQLGISGSKDDFEAVTDSLLKFARIPHRVWMLVDEVTVWENRQMAYFLPEEQKESPFYFVVTGSAGMSTWTTKRHLEKAVVDMPFLDPEQGLQLAQMLAQSKGSTLKDVLDGSGVPEEGLSDFLHEKFGGVPGYLAEMVLAQDVSTYLVNLTDRVESLLDKGAAHLGRERWAEICLREFTNPNNPYHYLRNLGLCGNEAPRGVIMVIVFSWLFRHAKTDGQKKLRCDS